MPKARLLYALATALTVCFGLVWRSRLLPLPPFAKKYGGDAAWALMVYFALRSGWPRISPRRSAALALAFSFGIEFSQLYHAPWIDAARATILGALVLGSTFNWPDFPAYLLGVAFGLTFDELLLRRGFIYPRSSRHRAPDYSR